MILSDLARFASANFPLDWIKTTKTMIYGWSKLSQANIDSSPSVSAHPYGSKGSTECCTLIAFYLGFTSVFHSFSLCCFYYNKCLQFECLKCTFLCVQTLKWESLLFRILLFCGNISRKSLFLCSSNANNNKKNCINKKQKRRDSKNHKAFVGFYVDSMGTFAVFGVHGDRVVSVNGA